MATKSEHQGSPEYYAFRIHYHKLVNAIQDPLPLATQLFSQGVITSAVKECVSTSGLSRLDKNNKLLCAVEANIQNEPDKFAVILSALKEECSMQSLVESIESKCFISAMTDDPNSMLYVCYMPPI